MEWLKKITTGSPIFDSVIGAFLFVLVGVGWGLFKPRSWPAVSAVLPYIGLFGVAFVILYAVRAQAQLIRWGQERDTLKTELRDAIGRRDAAENEATRADTHESVMNAAASQLLAWDAECRKEWWKSDRYFRLELVGLSYTGMFDEVRHVDLNLRAVNLSSADVQITGLVESAITANWLSGETKRQVGGGEARSFAPKVIAAHSIATFSLTLPVDRDEVVAIGGHSGEISPVIDWRIAGMWLCRSYDDDKQLQQTTLSLRSCVPPITAEQINQ